MELRVAHACIAIIASTSSATLAACTNATLQPSTSPPSVAEATSTSTDTPTATTTPSATQVATSGPTLTPSNTPAPSLTPTPNPFAGYTIPELAARHFGGSQIYVTETVEQSLYFIRYLISYDSDSRLATGMMNVPYGPGPYPVIVVNHGYIDPAVYQPGLDSRPMADFFAAHGYVAIMPDYRGYAESTPGPNPMRIGYAIDVLNLVESIDSLDYLDAQRVGLVGHSMGGGIATYVMVLNQRISAFSLYGSMSADQATNWQHIHDTWSATSMNLFAQTYGTPTENPDGYAAISPINFLDRVSAPVNLHHGPLDTQVPIDWSEDLAARLRAVGVETNYYVYPQQGHTFRDPDLTTFLLRDLTLFDQYVKGE